jgi:glycine/D-amino acid oxidase-like deaminating enzyme
VRNGEVSYWWQSRGLPARRPPLPGSAEADVCIVGAGYTGLWTAFYLKRADPGLRVIVLEAGFAGFGASGRNGGWVTATLPGSRARYATHGHGRAGVRELERRLRETVDEVGRVCADEGIDAGLVKGGTLTVATSAAQDARLRQELDTGRAWGDGPEILRYLGPAELAGRLQVAGAVGALYSPHCARVQPADLAAGLAEVVTRAGVLLYEGTPVTSISAGRARTPGGEVRAPYVLRCTEGFTAEMPGERRTLLPMNSSMIITGRLSDRAWKSIGWDGGETLSDEAHAYIYAQRTPDGRIALGGRGVPYRFGSRLDHDGAIAASTVAQLGKIAACSRPRPRPGSTTPGAVYSGCRGTGAPPSSWTRLPAWAGRAATPGMAWRPPTWPAGRSPTWYAASRARSPRCPGWDTTRLAGSPSLPAGRACTASTRSTARRTGWNRLAGRRAPPCWPARAT